ncbi:MAG: hypothetical protein ABI051_02485 [Vicinamibacterales bacterium]
MQAPDLLEVQVQPLAHHPRKWHRPILVALATAHHDLLALEIDVLHPQLKTLVDVTVLVAEVDLVADQNRRASDRGKRIVRPVGLPRPLIEAVKKPAEVRDVNQTIRNGWSRRNLVTQQLRLVNPITRLRVP